MAPIGFNTANIPVKTRQIVFILLIILGCAIIAALVGYCAGTLINLYRAHRQNKARAKKISDIEARMTSDEEGRKSIQRILSQINPPDIPPVPSPPTAYVARGRRVQRAVRSDCPVKPFVNDSYHAAVAPTFHPTCSSNHAANEPISDAVFRPCGGFRQSASSHSSEEIHQSRSPINRSASAPVVRPLYDNFISRSTPIPPIIAKSISAPRVSRFDIARSPTITMRDRYPVIFPGSSNYGTVPASSERPQLATAVDGEVVTVVTRQEHDVPAPSPVSNAERSVPNLHDNVGEDTLTNATHTEPESMLAYNHLP